ncbi:MAG: hypothetical protein ACLP3R_23225 [Candidatus Korobacteraceae bacterium]
MNWTKSKAPAAADAYILDEFVRIVSDIVDERNALLTPIELG